MFKFTKKDRRTNLDKEIDSTLSKMSIMAPKPEEDNRTNLDREIDSLLAEMANADKGSDEYLEMAKNLKILSDAKANDKSRLDEYSEMVDNLEKLHKVKTATKSTNIPWKEITVGVFVLAEMLMVLKYEKFDVITSKAFGLVTKGRV